MLNRPCLLVFIDGFPASYIDILADSGEWSSRKSVTPGLGFSVNIKAEMFAGMSPDMAGYFNEWSYTRKGRYRRLQPIFWISGLASQIYLLNRAIHRAWSMVLRRNILTIPFKYLPYFDSVPLDIYSRFYRLPTIFRQSPMLRVVDHSNYAANNMRDSKLVGEALREIVQGNSSLFVSLVDIDHIGHVNGLDSIEYEDRIQFLATSLNEMADLFQAKHPEGIVAVFSDHGMANVTSGVELSLETEFGRCSEDRYMYFMDSTMLRVWSFDMVMTHEIFDFLSCRVDGTLLTDDQRSYYGVTNPSFGTHIFVLDEGLVFCPSFFGRKMPKGMHGYMPEVSSQQGVLLTRGDASIADGVRHSRDLWGMFSEI